MPTKGYDVFYTEPDTVDEMYCKVCGTLCDVERSVIGPTSFGNQWQSAVTGMTVLPALIQVNPGMKKLCNTTASH
jgi:hypothetical protein